MALELDEIESAFDGKKKCVENNYFERIKVEREHGKVLKEEKENTHRASKRYKFAFCHWLRGKKKGIKTIFKRKSITKYYISLKNKFQ